MNTIRFLMTGTAPLLMHNARLADPLDPASKALAAVTSKRKKTDNDIEEIAKLEFKGSLYTNGANEPVIPARLIYGMLAGKGGAARMQKSGQQAKAGLFVKGNFSLQYDGPKDPDSLWKDQRFRSRVNAKVGPATIMRTRPIFEEWKVEVEVNFNPDILNRQTLIEWMQLAGEQVGIGDWRPQHGRFTATVIE